MIQNILRFIQQLKISNPLYVYFFYPFFPQQTQKVKKKKRKKKMESRGTGHRAASWSHGKHYRGHYRSNQRWDGEGESSALST